MSFDRELHFCRERGKYFYLFSSSFLWLSTNRDFFLRVKWKKLTFFEKFEKDVILLNI